MSIESLAERLADTSLAYALTDSTWLFGTLEAVHVLALSLVVGSIAIIDLRLLGIAGKDHDPQELLHRLLPFTWAGFALALASGTVMIFANPISYLANFFFRGKLLLLALAGANMVLFHLFSSRRLASQGAWAPRVSGAASLALWVSIVTFGRWIGFTL